MFLSAPACGGRQPGRRGVMFGVEFLSAPACGGRRHELREIVRALVVSIRARVRRATALAPAAGQLSGVSIRARVRRATQEVRQDRADRRFLSAPACGGRHPTRLQLFCRELFLSAPACGGRRRSWRCWRSRRCFYPRPRAAGDAADDGDREGGECFYPRPRAAGDLVNLV